MNFFLRTSIDNGGKTFKPESHLLSKFILLKTFDDTVKLIKLTTFFTDPIGGNK